MKKRIIIPIAVVCFLLILFVPIPAVYKDGGTKSYSSLTYKVVHWNRITDDDSSVYEEKRVYFIPDCYKSVDSLWADIEYELKKEAGNKRHLEFTEPWLDKETAEVFTDNPFTDIIITEIYSNCFFAETVIPMPYKIKLNGELGEEWCVGDQVIATYDIAYYDNEASRVEVDFSKVEESDWEPEPGVAYKPVIYLYPQKTTDVSVNLMIDGEFISTYPKYNGAWQVTAEPDGTLTDHSGQQYNYLYWEGTTNARYDFTEGFCVKGCDTAAFLEDALARLGLTRREANEFIVYWLPLMEQNEYNIISFQGDKYTDAAKLDINPRPDTLIRVFMAWYGSPISIEMEPQELSSPQRQGFTVVEWGGTVIE